ncbi:hydrogenase large subunit [Phenylobacterium montanum]|uniref:Nickel-dependent hydrogenase large subunit n=1 Tax=Phenylobacterium montanum TaxID=2823693 RepID=A0A975IWB8_9CAUL|nr:nickel-dependent hydrogenase large subunit [Caulobacter sp. S6]QUD89670.1 nickel-dependent hydrogenase large subunit [Caulobacter sp. S6]
MTGLADAHPPWSAILVDEPGWRAAMEALAAGELTLVSLWGEPGMVHMALSRAHGESVILDLPCPEGRYPSVGAAHAPAIRLERALFDLHGLVADGAVDTRPWLDHGQWEVRHPLGAAAPSTGPAPYAFLPVEGESLHQIPVGPVHAGIIEPGHFRFTANGETVARLEARLGYAHRGVDGLMAGAALDRAAQLAARVCGDSTVAYSLAFARAVEAALGFEAPPRAAWLRALLAEMERLANHLGDIGAICNDAAFSLMLAHCGVLREQVLRTAKVVFGHRLMMDCVVPGGVSVDLDVTGEALVRDLVRTIRERFPTLVELYDETAALQDRTVSTGIVPRELVQRFAAGGYVGRASGRTFDARRDFPYAPYDRFTFKVAVREEGDVNARVWVRIDEVDESLSLIEQILGESPTGPVHVNPPSGSGEGTALVEGFRGDILAWVRILKGRIERAHLRDPSWFQWPLIEACIEGNIVADFPLCNKSFNCAYAGCDL